MVGRDEWLHYEEESVPISIICHHRVVRILANSRPVQQASQAAWLNLVESCDLTKRKKNDEEEKRSE